MRGRTNFWDLWLFAYSHSSCLPFKPRNLNGTSKPFLSCRHSKWLVVILKIQYQSLNRYLFIGLECKTCQISRFFYIAKSLIQCLYCRHSSKEYTLFLNDKRSRFVYRVKAEVSNLPLALIAFQGLSRVKYSRLYDTTKVKIVQKKVEPLRS